MPDIIRIRPPEDADERSTLTGLLDFLRSTVELKLTGLTEQQAFARPVDPSALTPAGIVKHLIEETGRHLGHLDLLRESTDGVGE